MSNQFTNSLGSITWMGIVGTSLFIRTGINVGRFVKDDASAAFNKFKSAAEKGKDISNLVARWISKDQPVYSRREMTAIEKQAFINFNPVQHITAALPEWF